MGKRKPSGIGESLPTARGFGRIEFKDNYGATCSLQQSSISVPGGAVWLGPNDADPKVHIPHKGWGPVPFPKDTLFTTRMHLDRKQVKKLIVSLQRWVNTGEL